MALVPRQTGGSDGGRERPPIGTAETLALSVPMGMATIDAVAAAAGPDHSTPTPAQTPDSPSSLTEAAHPSALTKAQTHEVPHTPDPAHPPPESHSLERAEGAAITHEPATAPATPAPQPPVFTPLRSAPTPEAESQKAAEEAAPPPVLKAKSGHGRSKQATGDEDNDHSLLHTDTGSEGSARTSASTLHAPEFAPITADILPLIPQESSPDATEPAAETPIAGVPEPELPDVPTPEVEEPTGPDAAEPEPPLAKPTLPQPETGEPNHAPELVSALAGQSADEDTAFSFTLPTDAFRDHEGDTILYSARLSSGEPLPAWLSFDRGTGTFSGTPAQDDAGSLEITVMAGDGFGGRTDTNFTLTVSPVNDAPTISGMATSVTFAENTVNASPQVIDSSLSLADVDSTDFGGGTLTVSYSSGGGAQDALSFDTGGGTISLAGGNVTVSGTIIGTLTSSGAAGASLTVSFNGNATSTLVDTLLEKLTYANSSDTPSAARTLGITLTDGDGGSVTTTTQVNVTAESDNEIPVFTGTIPDQIAGVGIAFSYDAHGFFSDPDAGDTLTYTASLSGGGALPGWLSIDAITGVLSGTPTGTGS